MQSPAALEMDAVSQDSDQNIFCFDWCSSSESSLLLVGYGNTTLLANLSLTNQFRGHADAAVSIVGLQCAFTFCNRIHGYSITHGSD